MKIQILSQNPDFLRYLAAKAERLASSLPTHTQAGAGEVTLSCSPAHDEIFAVEIKAVLAESAAYSYKREFFSEHLSFPGLSPEVASALIRAYTVFERAEETKLFDALKISGTVDMDALIGGENSAVSTHWRRQCEAFGGHPVPDDNTALKVVKVVLKGEGSLLRALQLKSVRGRLTLSESAFGSPGAIARGEALAEIVWYNPSQLSVTRAACRTRTGALASRIFSEKLQNRLTIAAAML